MTKKIARLEDVSVQFARILFATDLSSTSAAALPYAAAVARRFGSELYVLHVVPSENYAHIPSEERDEALVRIKQEAEKRIRTLLTTSRLEGVPHHEVIDHGEIWPVLASIVDKKEIGLIVCGTHGRLGVEKLFFGSAAEEISRVAMCPVLLVGPEVTVAPEAEVGLERVLFETDFSLESLRALKYAYAMAKSYAAHLDLLHVVEVSWTESLATRVAADAFFRQQLREKGWPAPEAGLEPQFIVKFGSREGVILETADNRKAQLIVLNVPGSAHPDVASHLPGPLAYNIASHARCPVLAVRGSADARC